MNLFCCLESVFLTGTPVFLTSTTAPVTYEDVLSDTSTTPLIELLAVALAGLVLLGISLLFYRILNPKPKDNTLRRLKRK